MVYIYARSQWTSSTSAAVDIKADQTRAYIHYPGDISNVGLESKEGIVARLQGIRTGHLNDEANNYSDIAYNWAVDQIGRIWELRGKRQSGANGTTLANLYGQSILCMVGLFETPTRELIDSVNALLGHIQSWQPRASEVLGHRDAISTLCPGEPLYGLIQDGVLKFSIYPPVELPISDGGGEPVDIPEPGTGIEVGLTVDGRFGQSTVRVLQRRLGVTADGKAGSGTWRALQAFLGTSVDGVVSNQSYTAEELGNGITGGWQYTGRNSSGSSMVRALQAYIGVSVDGVWGESTTRALQQHLNRYDSAFR